jgi:hypothetical protein
MKSEKLYIRREPLSRDGYTQYDEYFGIGTPLYFVTNSDYTYMTYVRARDLAAAKRKFPGKRFGRGMP